jgi:hypothetical protein
MRAIGAGLVVLAFASGCGGSNKRVDAPVLPPANPQALP